MRQQNMIAIYGSTDAKEPTYYGPANEEERGYYALGMVFNVKQLVGADMTNVITDLSGADVIDIAHALILGKSLGFKINVHCIVPSREALDALPSQAHFIWKQAKSQTFGSMQDMIDQASSLLIFSNSPDSEPIVALAKERGIPVVAKEPYQVCQDGIKHQ